MPRVAVIVGSLRRESINRKLAQALIRLADGKLDMQLVDVSDVPLFDQDLEENLPPAVARYKDEIKAAGAVLFVTPEYNRSLPGVMKNLIDWGTRPRGQNSWSGKPAAIIGTSAGKLGTAAAQLHLRSILSILNVQLMGQPEAYVTMTPELIDADNNVTDEKTREVLERFLDRFAAWIERSSK
jgi:chromate reductase